MLSLVFIRASFIPPSVPLYVFCMFLKIGIAPRFLKLLILFSPFSLRLKRSKVRRSGRRTDMGRGRCGGGGGSGQRRDACRLCYVPQSCVRRRLLQARILRNYKVRLLVVEHGPRPRSLFPLALHKRSTA